MREIIAKTYRILWRAPFRIFYGYEYVDSIRMNELLKKFFSVELRLLNYYLRSIKFKDADLLEIRTPSGTFLGFDESTLYSANEIFMEGVYDKFLSIRRRDTVIDIGANVGIFTSKAALNAKLVLAVEPHPLNFALLRYNIKKNHLNNVVPINVALADYEGVANLYAGRFSGSHTIVCDRAKDKSNYVRVRVKTLDNVAECFELQEPLFIKIDAEGAEPEILKGAKAVLSKGDVRLSIAAYHTSNEAFKVASFLIGFGFKVYLYYPEPGIRFVYAVKRN